MTAKDYRSLGRYIRRIADLMGLRDWSFELSHNPADGDAFASIATTYGRKLAVIEVCPNWLNLDPAVQRHSIVHELIHAHLGALKNYVYHALPTLLGEASWSAFESAYRMHDELATDGIADGIAAGFPLWNQ